MKDTLLYCVVQVIAKCRAEEEERVLQQGRREAELKKQVAPINNLHIVTFSHVCILSVMVS